MLNYLEVLKQLPEATQTLYIKKVNHSDGAILYPYPVTLKKVLTECQAKNLIIESIVCPSQKVVIWSDNIIDKLTQLSEPTLLNELNHYNVQRQGKELKFHQQAILSEDLNEWFLNYYEHFKIMELALAYINDQSNSYYYLQGLELYKDELLVYKFSQYNNQCSISLLEGNNWKEIHENFIRSQEHEEIFNFLDKKAA